MDPKESPPPHDTVMIDSTGEDIQSFVPSQQPDQARIQLDKKDSVNCADPKSPASACTTDAANNVETAEPLNTYNDPPLARHEPENDDPKPKPRRGAKTRRMKKRYLEMMELREEVLPIRNELMSIYEILNNEAQKLRQSGEVLLNSLEGEMNDLLPHKQAGHLRAMWDEVHTCGVAFNHSIERALEYENLLRDPQEELFAAEECFLEAAELVTARKIVPDESKQRVEPCEAGVGIVNAEESEPATNTSINPAFWTDFMTPSEASVRDRRAYEVKESDSEPLVWSHLRERKVFLQQLMEQLDSIDGDYEEEKCERDFLLDRGDVPDIPESEFEGEYGFYRGKNLKMIEQALGDIERLKAECIAQGLDPEPPQREESPAPLSVYPAQNTGPDSPSKPKGHPSRPGSAKADDAMSTKAEVESQAGSGSEVSVGRYRDAQFELQFGSAPVRCPAERPTRVLEWLEGSSAEQKIAHVDDAKQNKDDTVAIPSQDPDASAQ